MEYQIKNKISMPRYQQIAVEIATRIANEEYKVGDKVEVTLLRNGAPVNVTITLQEFPKEKAQ